MRKHRKPLPMKKSKRLFTKTAKKVHPKNVIRPMRGGFRM